MSEEPLFLDVNVPMYAAGKDHPYKEACTWVLTEIANDRLPVVIDTEIVQEVLYRFGALQEWKLAVEMATSLLDLIPVVLPVTARDMHTAVQLFEQFGPQGVKARDVLHAAVLQNNGIVKIISTDRHFDQLPNVVRLDPQELFTLVSGSGDLES